VNGGATWEEAGPRPMQRWFFRNESWSSRIRTCCGEHSPRTLSFEESLAMQQAERDDSPRLSASLPAGQQPRDEFEVALAQQLRELQESVAAQHVREVSTMRSQIAQLESALKAAGAFCSSCSGCSSTNGSSHAIEASASGVNDSGGETKDNFANTVHKRCFSSAAEAWESSRALAVQAAAVAAAAAAAENEEAVATDGNPTRLPEACIPESEMRCRTRPPRLSKLSLASKFSELEGSSTSEEDFPGRMSAISRSSASRESKSHRVSAARRRAHMLGPNMTQEMEVRRCYSDLNLELYPIFNNNEEQDNVRTVKTSDKGREAIPLADSASQRVGDELRDETGLQGLLGHLVSHPLRTRRIVYDITAMLIIGLDMLVLPMDIVELLDQTKGLRIMSLCVSCWWTFDLMCGFFRGFQRHGVVELRIRYTALEYVRSWFCLDLLLVSIDWCAEFLFGQEEDEERGLNVLRQFKGGSRMVRACRMLKFLRFARMPKLYAELQAMLSSDFAQTTFRICTWIVGILMLNHIIACVWFGVGSLCLDEPCWTEEAKVKYEHGGEWGAPDNSYFYLTALHWATTQFTPASMEVVPKNWKERLCAICTLFMSLVLFSSFLSSITNDVATLRRKNSECSKNKRNLERFLCQNRISLELSSSIQSVVFTQYDHMRNSWRLHEGDVALLQLLPRSLKEQMRVEIYYPIVIRHPLISAMAAHEERALLRVCTQALNQESMNVGQELFTYGKEADKVHFVTVGLLSYQEGPAASALNEVSVPPGTWLCDQVLWMPWVHRGKATVEKPSELTQLDGQAFRNIVLQRPTFRDLCCNFATSYVKAMRDDVCGQCCSDLGASITVLNAIVEGVEADRSSVATASSQAWSNKCGQTQTMVCQPPTPNGSSGRFSAGAFASTPPPTVKSLMRTNVSL